MLTYHNKIGLIKDINNLETEEFFKEVDELDSIFGGEYDNINTFVERKANDTFKTVWDGNKVNTLLCKTCGASKFSVGKAVYATFIRCETCGYELLVHEG